MASLYFSELNKLKSSQKQLERYQLTIMDQLCKFQSPESQQLIEYFQASRHACDGTYIKLELQDILDKLRYVRKAVILECGNQIPDLEAFQKNLINVINRIQDLKVQSQAEVGELSSELNQLTGDINLYNERLCVWTEPLKLDIHRNEIHPKVDTTSDNIPNDVKKFMEFVKKSKGHENGWTSSDHHLFLKLRRKFPNVEDLSLNIHEMLPDISLEEVKKHGAWYVKYLSLKEKNNEAIKRWQKLKKDIEKTDNDFVHLCEKSEEIEKNPIKYIKTVEKRTNERNKVREDLEHWKKEREIVKSEQQTIKVEEIKHLRMKEKEREHKNKLKKEMVKKWKEGKLASEEDKTRCEKAKEEIEQNVRISVANEMIKHYQIRDQIKYNRIIEHSENTDTLTRKVKNTYQVSRDPKRLFRPTQQWVRRFLDNSDNSPIKQVNFVGRIQKLHKPCWRQNL